VRRLADALAKLDALKIASDGQPRHRSGKIRDPGHPATRLRDVAQGLKKSIMQK
jgi:hypothetical protein